MFTHLIFIFAIITSCNHAIMQSRCQWFASMVKIVNFHLLRLWEENPFRVVSTEEPVRTMNVTAGSCLNPKDIAARTQTATIQITVSAKQNPAAVANLASNILSQAGRQLCFIAFVSYLLHCTRFVLSSCFFARSLQSLYTINNTKRAVTKTGLPMTVLEMWWN